MERESQRARAHTMQRTHAAAGKTQRESKEMGQGKGKTTRRNRKSNKQEDEMQ